MTPYTAKVSLLLGLLIGLGLGCSITLGGRLKRTTKTSKSEALSRLRGILKRSERRYVALETTVHQQQLKWDLLEQVRGALIQELEPERVLQCAVETILNETLYTGVSVSLVEGDVLVARYSVGDSQGGAGALQPFLFQPRSDAVTGVEPQTRKTPFKATVSELVVPLFDGFRLVGTLSVQGRSLSQTDRDLLDALSKEVSVALERSRLLSEVRQSEANLQSFLDSASDLIQSVSPEGHFFYVNQTWKDTLGYSDRDLAQLTLLELVHPENVAHCRELFRRVLTGENVGLVEAIFLAKDGRRVRVRGSMNCHFEGGEPIATRAILRDITEAAAADAALRHYQGELEEKNRRLELQQRDLARLAAFRQTLVAFVNDTLRGGTIGDTTGKAFYQQLLECAVRAIPGAQAGSLLLGRSQSSLQSQHEAADPAQAREYTYVAAVGYDLTALQRVTFKERELSFQQTGDTPQLIADYSLNDTLEEERRSVLERAGRTHDIAVSLSVPVHLGGEITAFLNLDNFDDATAFTEETVQLTEAFASQVGVLMTRLKLEAELRSQQRDIGRANKELEQANRLKSEFLANMSHELRTPLTAIIGFSELLKEELFGPLNAKQRDYVRDILEAGHHLLALINDILDLSKIEAGHLELAPAQVDLAEILEGVLNVIRERAHEAELTLHADVPPALPLYADPRKLKQVLYNLLSNAVKFTPLGGEINLKVEACPETVRFTVTDTGIGIAQEHLSGLFQEFSQVDSSLSRRHDGTGLGLALSKRLVALHGGEVWVKSELGKGSTFGFSLPRQKAKPTPSKPYTSKRRALVIEDDERTANLLCAYLETGGFEVLRAANGLEGLNLVKQHRPDVLTLDIMMPVMSGWRFLEALAAEPEVASTPVVIVSVVSHDVAGEIGAAATLKKPVERNTLLDALSRALEQASPQPLSSDRTEDITDEVDAAQRLSDYLSALGLEPLQASSARDMLEVMSQSEPSSPKRHIDVAKGSS